MITSPKKEKRPTIHYSLMTVAARGPILCFVGLLNSLMTVVKSVGDGLIGLTLDSRLSETESLRLN